MTLDQLPVLPDNTGEIFVPCTKAGADYKMQASPLCFAISTSGATINFAATNGTRFLLFTSGTSNEAKTFYIFNVSTAGAVTYVGVKTGTAISISTATRAFSVTANNPVYIGIIVFNGSVTTA